MNRIIKHKIINRSSEVIFTMLLFLLFTFMILSVLISGVSVYKNTEEVMRNRYEERTAIAYVMTRLRQCDSYNAVSVDSINSINSLVLIREELLGNEYKTYIYCYNGWIHELFVDAYMEFDPEAGTRIVEAEGLEFIIKEPGLLYIKYESDTGTTNNIHINLRSMID